MKKNCFYLLLFFIPLLSLANPPPAKDVFQLTTRQIDPNTFAVDWHIKKGFFLYKKSVAITECIGSNFHLGSILYPDALSKTDRQGKNYFIYRDKLALPVSILGEQPGEALLEVHYQGCADDGFCYPPQTSQVKLTINANLALTDVAIENTPEKPASKVAPATENDKLNQLFAGSSWGIIILSFFGFGLLLAFTPCVLPMVPVLSGIIVGHSKTLSTRKAFLLSLSYVLSMSITYAAVGAIVASLGSNLQIAMQSPWTLTLFSLIFVLLALSMFNFYELKLPISWQAKLANVTRSQSGGHYLGAAIMGCLSTLILSPCVTAPLIGALGYIAQSGDILLGSLALFFLSLGMGTPLLLIGTSAGKLLPHTGHWMNAVKSFFGVMLLAVAIYLMERVLPPVLIMGAWASLLIFSGIFIGALDKANTHHEKLRQGLGIICLVYGLLVLIGASVGNSNPVQPLKSVHKTHYQVTKSPIKVVKTIDDIQNIMAHSNGKPVLLDFYADWCASCKVIAATTLKSPAIQKALQHFLVLKVDLTANNADTRALLSHFNVVAPPTFLFFNTEKEELKKLRLVGDVSSETFYAHLNATLFAAKKSSIDKS